MRIMAYIAAEPSSLFALTSSNKLHDLIFPIPVDVFQETQCSDAPISTWQLKVLILEEANSLSIFCLVQVLKILQMEVEHELRGFGLIIHNIIIQ